MLAGRAHGLAHVSVPYAGDPNLPSTHADIFFARFQPGPVLRPRKSSPP